MSQKRRRKRKQDVLALYDDSAGDFMIDTTRRRRFRFSDMSNTNHTNPIRSFHLLRMFMSFIILLCCSEVKHQHVHVHAHAHAHSPSASPTAVPTRTPSSTRSSKSPKSSSSSASSAKPMLRPKRHQASKLTTVNQKSETDDNPETQSKTTSKGSESTTDSRRDEDETAEAEESAGEQEEAEAEKSSPAETAELAAQPNYSDDKNNKTNDNANVDAPYLPQPRLRPPNVLYRFLLRQGRIGHVIVMFLFLLSEFIALYIPPLAKVFGAITTRLLPTPVEPIHRRHHRHGPSAVAVAAALATADRTGQSKRQKRAWTQQADQLALQQLQRLVLSEAKYRHVSTEFLQRHGLGPYAAAASALSSSSSSVQKPAKQLQLDKKSTETTTATSRAKTAVQGLPKKSDKKSRKQKMQEEDVESDSEVDSDWVWEALFQEDYNQPANTQQRRRRQQQQQQQRFIEPTVSVSVGSRGSSAVSIGFEIGGAATTASQTRRRNRNDERRSALLETALTTRRKRKVVGPRLSDRDGGDGIFGRIRAVAGTDSRLSRSLLGAYPGDAVPPSEAASPRGVTELAERYGWGDWSEEESDGDDGSDIAKVFLRRIRHGKIKSRRNRPSNVSLGMTVAANLQGTSSTDVSEEPWPRTPAFGRTRHTSENTKLASFTKARSLGRPTLRSFNERLEQSRKVRDAPLASSLTLGSRSRVLDRDASSSSKSRTKTSSITRPAFRTLNERPEQLSQAKRRRDEE